MMSSCTVAQPAWDGVENVTTDVVTTAEDVVSNVYSGGKNMVVDGVNAVEGVVTGTYNLVTSPFVGENIDE